MGLFASKEKKRQKIVAKYLGERFALPIEVVDPWVNSTDHRVIVTLPFAYKRKADGVKHALIALLEQANLSLDVVIQQRIQTKQTARPPVNNIRNIIAVASGKGGVGKSTTSLNLAFALQAEGAKVGILDADIYGPSIPIMLGNAGASPTSEDNKHMRPLEAFGLVANSIGYLVPQEDAAIWRGPMASKALQQILMETLWPVLDYLIVDMPPGTGDIQLTMAQQVPLTAAVVVTTPQDLALADAQKGIAMFNKVGVPVVGLIENMAYFQCKSCGTKEYIFAQDGGSALAQRYQLPLLGAFPLETTIREHADSGKPLLLEQPDSALSELYAKAARQLAQQLAVFLPDHEAGDSHIKGDPISVTVKG